jgi:hypothetical protein
VELADEAVLNKVHENIKNKKISLKKKKTLDITYGAIGRPLFCAPLCIETIATAKQAIESAFNKQFISLSILAQSAIGRPLFCAPLCIETIATAKQAIL